MRGLKLIIINFVFGIFFSALAIVSKHFFDVWIGTAEYPFVFYFWPVIISALLVGFFVGFTSLCANAVYLSISLGLDPPQNKYTFIVYLFQSLLVLTVIQYSKNLKKRIELEKNILTTIMENTQAEVAYLDYYFNFVKVNTAYESSCGYKKEDLYGKNHFDLFPNKQNERIFKRARNLGRIISYKQKPFINPKYPEKTSYWNWILTPIKDPEGIVVGMVLSLLDVTSDVEELKRKDDFLGMVSHEIKSPLTVIKSYSYLIDKVIKNKTTSSKIAQYSKIIDYKVDSIVKIVNDLTSLARIKSGTLRYIDGVFDMDELLETICKNSNNLFNDHNIIITGKNIGKIVGDKGRMEQLFSNLISNAVKYSPHSQTVTIGKKRTKGKYEILIKDTGIGIEKRYLSKIFAPYFRINERNSAPGLGLGLSLCEEIVSHYKGKIEVESELGKGSTFKVELPIK